MITFDKEELRRFLVEHGPVEVTETGKKHLQIAGSELIVNSSNTLGGRSSKVELSGDNIPRELYLVRCEKCDKVWLLTAHGAGDARTRFDDEFMDGYKVRLIEHIGNIGKVMTSETINYGFDVESKYMPIINYEAELKYKAIKKREKLEGISFIGELIDLIKLQLKVLDVEAIHMQLKVMGIVNYDDLVTRLSDMLKVLEVSNDH